MADMDVGQLETATAIDWLKVYNEKFSADKRIGFCEADTV
jgi:hypothetical protein